MEAVRTERRIYVWLKGKDLTLERENLGVSMERLAEKMEELSGEHFYMMQISRWERQKEFRIDDKTFGILAAALSSF